jgi:hypothetical protein
MLHHVSVYISTARWLGVDFQAMLYSSHKYSAMNGIFDVSSNYRLSSLSLSPFWFSWHRIVTFMFTHHTQQTDKLLISTAVHLQMLISLLSRLLLLSLSGTRGSQTAFIAHTCHHHYVHLRFITGHHLTQQGIIGLTWATLIGLLPLLCLSVSLVRSLCQHTCRCVFLSRCCPVPCPWLIKCSLPVPASHLQRCTSHLINVTYSHRRPRDQAMQLVSTEGCRIKFVLIKWQWMQISSHLFSFSAICTLESHFITLTSGQLSLLNIHLKTHSYLHRCQ